MDSISMKGVREYTQDDNIVEFETWDEPGNRGHGRAVLYVDTGGNYDGVAIDLLDVIRWVRENRPELIEETFTETPEICTPDTSPETTACDPEICAPNCPKNPIEIVEGAHYWVRLPCSGTDAVHIARPVLCDGVVIYWELMGSNAEYAPGPETIEVVARIARP